MNFNRNAIETVVKKKV